MIAQVNQAMPRTLGESFVHVDDIDYGVEVDVPPYVYPPPEIGEVERRIGEYAADLVPDEATLQMGIGAIPTAVALALRDKRDLGIHTEMMTDCVVDLVEAGVVTGMAKERNRGKVLCTFMMGTEKLYRFAHDNPMVEMRACDFTNDTHVIRGFRRMTAINSAISIDLTGQVCADSIGWHLYSGVGGQMDFIRGAALARRGTGHHRLAVDGGRGADLAHHAVPGGGIRRRDHAGPRPHRRHRVGRRRAAWEVDPGAGPGADRDRPPGLPGRAHGPGPEDPLPVGISGRSARPGAPRRSGPARPPATAAGRRVVVDAARPLRRPPRAEVSSEITTGGRAEWP